MPMLLLLASQPPLLWLVNRFQCVEEISSAWITNSNYVHSTRELSMDWNWATSKLFVFCFRSFILYFTPSCFSSCVVLICLYNLSTCHDALFILCKALWIASLIKCAVQIHLSCLLAAAHRFGCWDARAVSHWQISTRWQWNLCLLSQEAFFCLIINLIMN